jgi:pSer/pThr/pTyr-binding forkhead associated (FHA) protein
MADAPGMPCAPPDLLIWLPGRRLVRRASAGCFVIGREVPPADLRVDHPAISRLHARLVPGARWELVDYDSRNGIFLNGWRIEHGTVISDGATVHFGSATGIPVTFHYLTAAVSTT